MQSFEYKVVTAPQTGTKAKGVKTTGDRFALSLTNTLNEMAEDGWEYVRAETLPCDERKGLTGSQTTYQNVLVFRRGIDEVQEAKTSAPPLRLDPPQPPKADPVIMDAKEEPPLRRFTKPPDDVEPAG